MEGRRRKDSNVESGSQPWGLCICIFKTSSVIPMGRQIKNPWSTDTVGCHTLLLGSLCKLFSLDLCTVSQGRSACTTSQTGKLRCKKR